MIGQDLMAEEAFEYDYIAREPNAAVPAIDGMVIRNFDSKTRSVNRQATSHTD